MECHILISLRSNHFLPDFLRKMSHYEGHEQYGFQNNCQNFSLQPCPIFLDIELLHCFNGKTIQCKDKKQIHKIRHGHLRKYRIVQIMKKIGDRNCRKNAEKIINWICQECKKMKNKEEIITLWFNMWLEKKDLGIDRIFSKNILYTESWGPEYRGIEKIKLWFYEWNSRADVLAWDIKQFFHKDNQTIVEWYFKFKEKNEESEDFSGVSLIEWTEDGKIENLKEFMCKLNNYDPYEKSDIPEFIYT